MSGEPTLSAVARRRAKLEAAVVTGSDPIQKIDHGPGTPANTTFPAVDTAPPSPLKRKSSGKSSRRNEISTGHNIDFHSRKKARAHQYSQVAPATEEPMSLDYLHGRPYSPSQPPNVSSEEEVLTITPTPERAGPAYTSQQATEPDLPFRSTKNIPDLIEEKNCFTISPEDANLIFGRCTTARVITLSQGESLLFVGTMELTLLQGSIRLLGTILSPSKTSHKIFAPRSHPIPVLEALGVPASTSFGISSQEGPDLISRLPKHITQALSSSHVVLALQELVTGVEELGRVVQTFSGIFEPDLRDRGATQQILRSAYMYRAESQMDPSFDFPDDWQHAITSVLSVTSSEELGSAANHPYDTPVVLVRGSKNSGKSTFSRLLANNLTGRYHRVAFIDCDLGQSEFTPAGMVSLNVLEAPIFGPPFTHTSSPRHAHFVGGNSPKTSPSHYLEALGDLAQRYQLEIKYSESLEERIIEDGSTKITDSVPLVINTQGWVKGLGADLLQSIEGLFSPTHIVDFQHSRVPSSLEPFQARPQSFLEHSRQDLSTNSHQLIKLLPMLPSSRSPRFSAADLRSLALASYFYGRNYKDKGTDQGGLSTRWDTSLSIRDAAPIAVDIHSGLENITIIAPAGDDVVQADLPRAIVCGLVGLVVSESLSTQPETVYTQGGLPPPPHSSRCVGLGFVRGASATHLHLLTPVPASQLRLCRALVLGELTMPVWAFLEPEKDTQEENGLPFLQWGRSVAEDAGGERRRIRRNVMRRGQF
ncbi:unnamed protein product [Rhizoctonia solani]|uniref:Polynucleotide 5'-hydroxyl-kinase GRC3 n=1 Tax=Rhizoctonia solani TaxID=456999 RepID=A0A8H2WP79_9AGAM|nr:unnamed protein product [Rhizoctonia solani]